MSVEIYGMHQKEWNLHFENSIACSAGPPIICAAVSIMPSVPQSEKCTVILASVLSLRK